MGERESDITIIGAGPAGMTAALFLAKNEVPVTLIEKKEFPRDKICGDCLGGYALSVLRQIDEDLFERFVHFSEKKVGSGVHFFGPNRQKISIEATTRIHHDMREVAICRRLDFDNFLMKEVKRHHLIDVRENIKVSNITRTPDRLFLRQHEGSILGTRLAIVATGSQQSLVKKLSGSRSPQGHFAFGARGYYENVGGLDEQGYIELHFLKELAPGYLWIFPLSGNRANVGLGLPRKAVFRKKINLEKLLKFYLQEHIQFGSRFKNARQLSGIKSFPLALGGSRISLSGDRYLLAGDAGNLIEPFFGEGIGHAMYSGKFAAEHAIRCLGKKDFSAAFNRDYDSAVYGKLGSALRFSKLMHQMAHYPGLINFVFNRLSSNSALEAQVADVINGNIPKSRINAFKLCLRVWLGY